ncbi:MAG: MFS transporter [Pseudomonadota bacterium]
MTRVVGERRRLILSFAYFALLLASYYLIRPVRDALAAGTGAASIKFLASAVFGVMCLLVPLFGWLVSRVRRAWLLPSIYAFFALNLVGFAAAFRLLPDAHWLGPAFYVWTTVFNLFVVSVFWSFMADLWREEEGRRLFGVIAAGGSLGGLAGPLLARLLVGTLGHAGLALLAAALLGAALGVVLLLLRELGEREGDASRLSLAEPIGGEILAGLTGLWRSPYLLGIAALVALGSVLGMFVYIELARAAAAGFASGEARTAFYAQRDLWVNGGAFVLQLAAVGPLARRLGVRAVLTGSATLAAFAFAGLTLVPLAGSLIAVNVLLRATEFGLGKPARDMLYTVVSTEAKYKSKNLIDTVIYRAMDAAAGWLHAGLSLLGLSLAGIAAAASGLALLLLGIAWRVGSGYRQRGGH